MPFVGAGRHAGTCRYCSLSFQSSKTTVGEGPTVRCLNATTPYRVTPSDIRLGVGSPRGSLPEAPTEPDVRLSHPALRHTASLRDRGITDARLRQRILLQQAHHLAPRDVGSLRAATEPIAPTREWPDTRSG